ncbi:TPA: cysteine--tRNA ligase [Candidatus Nomurabacteria bacterium]|nr:MAG: cysteinyl-tRNA synthetase [Parcubacteria bacterium RAAC4_OD1_1]HCY26580.1 cysteine--tRNA ligase [Candidatus Nomurabacteria bacterium]
MAIKFYNTLHRKKEVFKSIKNKKVGLYTCGPTVYDLPHIGNFRAYIFSDLVKRYLLWKGYDVKHIMNITDIDDKTIKKSIEQNKKLKDITEFYITEFYKDCNSLNILKADKYTKATSYIEEMIKMINNLMKKGYAYKVDGGSIYFDIHKFKDYGKLSNFKLKDLKTNAKGRLNNKDEYGKDDVRDFALWKSYDKEDGEIYFESPFGRGRPGWHIECSAMSTYELGKNFDIHTGGVDNIFPHHENEIAQSKCGTGGDFVKYWMHNEHLLVDGKKMSKSLGNFYTLRDLNEKDIDPIAFRYFIYGSHYRNKINFTLNALSGAENALKKLREFYQNLPVVLNTKKINKSYADKFTKVMDDDLNTSKALAVVWNLVKDKKINDSSKKATLFYFDKVLGFDLDKKVDEIIPEEIKKIAEERELARKNKDWSKSDNLREEIASLGYEIKDTQDGYKINKK